MKEVIKEKKKQYFKEKEIKEKAVDKIPSVLHENKNTVSFKKNGKTTETISIKSSSPMKRNKKIYFSKPHSRNNQKRPKKEFHSDSNLIQVKKKQESNRLPDIRQFIDTSINTNQSANTPQNFHSQSRSTLSNHRAVIKQKKQKYSLFVPLMV